MTALRRCPWSLVARASLDFSRATPRRLAGAHSPCGLLPPGHVLRTPSATLRTVDCSPASMLTAFLADAADKRRFSKYLLAEMASVLPDQRLSREEVALLVRPSLPPDLFAMLVGLAATHARRQLLASLMQAFGEHASLQTLPNLRRLVKSCLRQADAEDLLRSIVGVVNAAEDGHLRAQLQSALTASEFWFLNSEVKSEVDDAARDEESLQRLFRTFIRACCRIDCYAIPSEQQVAHVLKVIGRDDEKLADFMNVLKEENVLLTRAAAEVMSKWWKKGHRTSRQAALDVVGWSDEACRSCGRQMELFPVSPEAVAALREDLRRWLACDPLKMVATLEHMRKYEETLRRQMARGRRFDCVVDFMNCVYGKSPREYERNVADFFSVLTASIVPRFRFTSLLLVSKYSRNIRDHVERLQRRLRGVDVRLFLCSRDTKDDYFLIDAALWSGPACFILSGDQLRQHRALVSAEQQAAMRQWQKARQIKFDKNSRRVEKPHRLLDAVHGDVEAGWHLPYVEDDAETLDAASPIEASAIRWLCLSVRETAEP